MNSTYWLLFFLIAFLDIIFVAVRASLLYVRHPQLSNLRDLETTAAKRVINLVEIPRLRVSLRMGTTLLHFLFAGISWLLFLTLIPGLSNNIPAILGVLFLIGLLILMLEFILEGFILRNIEAWAMRFALLGQVFDFLLSPISRMLIYLMGAPATAQSALELEDLEDELKTWAKADQAEGGLENDERKMIYSIFQFGNTLCREIMVPRIDIFGLAADTTLDKALESTTLLGHSRVPVFDDSIDNIIGMAYVKDMLRVQMGDDNGNPPIRGMLRPAYFVPENKGVSELLREMQQREVHAVIVLDEYGGTAGMVTLEDIVEEIVGEIRDEYDQAEEEHYQQLGPDEYIFHGLLDLDDFNELLDTSLATDVADTLGGFIYGEIGRVPLDGEQIEVEDWMLTVEKVSRRRISKVSAKRQPPKETDEEGTHETD